MRKICGEIFRGNIRGAIKMEINKEKAFELFKEEFKKRNGKNLYHKMVEKKLLFLIIVQ